MTPLPAREVDRHPATCVAQRRARFVEVGGHADERAPAVALRHVFAEDRRLNRTRYTSRAMVGLGAERSVLMLSNTMC